jgi:hypothetical protein
MSSGNYTKAPWRTTDPGFIKSGDTLVASVYPCAEHVTDEDELVYETPEIEAEAIANCSLIAAAPDLLEVLKEFAALEVKGHALIDRLQFSDVGRELASKITAAITKAEGGRV